MAFVCLEGGAALPQSASASTQGTSAGGATLDFCGLQSVPFVKKTNSWSKSIPSR